ncbi:S1 family peptidase [Phytohabitans rumicis]|uniref:Serine protease n=1 Tax=Phytohabitans rumicis TaxID=1076125 RepID=A0A6V8LP96_9ACTN|nr:S1 family peptidase [Phytohabitans rumicis]GFJ94555.1 serine protease [Phytohabitans rumicis]
MKGRLAALAAGILLPVGVLAAPAGAAPDPGTAPATADAASPAMLSALARDLGLTATEARARLAREDVAGRADAQLRKDLGAAYAGGWLTDGASTLVVGVTDAGQAARVRAAGATPKVVARSAAQLDQLKAVLDRNAAKAPAASVPGWYVDVVTNSVVVLARGNASAATAFAALAKSGAVRVVASNETPKPLYDVVGGDAYYIGGGRCSVGFSVTGGFVTAGHCGSTGDTTTGYNQVSQGTFRASSFPGNDYSWVQVNSNWTPTPTVDNYSGGTVTVAGSTEAAVGASICRSGSTTGWHCGTVSAKNQTVNYAEGSVSGLTRTNVCAEPGDSGGSWLSGQQAQGVTSGGSGDCTSGGTTYFQPVNEILSAYGLTLTTSGGGGGGGSGCSGYEFTRTGSLSGTGVSAYQPDGSYYQSTVSGTHSACLDGPSGVDFDLYLQKWNGSAWAAVASGTSANPDETITYSGTAGYYRYRVYSYSGSGSYTLGFSNP